MDPLLQDSSSHTLVNPYARGRSHSQSCNGNASVATGGAIGRRQVKRISPPRVTHGSGGSHFMRLGRATYHRSSRSTRHPVRHSTANSKNSDSNHSTYPGRWTGNDQQKKSFRPLPPELDYDGKFDWTSFYRRFTSYDSEKNWDGSTSLTHLGWCLKGKIR